MYGLCWWFLIPWSIHFSVFRVSDFTTKDAMLQLNTVPKCKEGGLFPVLPKAGCSVPSLADLHAVTSLSPRGMSPGIRTQWLTEQGAPPGAGPTLGLPRATSLGRTGVFSRIPESIWKPVFSNSAPKQLEGFFSPCWIQSTSF